MAAPPKTIGWRLPDCRLFNSDVPMQEQPGSAAAQDAAREATSGLLWAFEKRPMSYDLGTNFLGASDDFGFLTSARRKKRSENCTLMTICAARWSRCCDALVRMHLDDFCVRCVPSLTEKEKSLVSGLVLVIWSRVALIAVSSLISDIAQYGATEALKKSTKVETGSTFGHVFYGLRTAIEIFVVLVMFDPSRPGFRRGDKFSCPRLRQLGFCRR